MPLSNIHKYTKNNTYKVSADQKLKIAFGKDKEIADQKLKIAFGQDKEIADQQLKIAFGKDNNDIHFDIFIEYAGNLLLCPGNHVRF